MSLPLDANFWVGVKDVATVVFGALGAFYYRRSERHGKSARDDVEKLNGHVEAVDKIQEDMIGIQDNVNDIKRNVLTMRRHMAEQSRRIQNLETTREQAAIEKRQLENRIETLESRSA